MKPQAYFKISDKYPDFYELHGPVCYYKLSEHLKADHHLPTSETPFVWCFAGGPMVARYCVLAGRVLRAFKTMDLLNEHKECIYYDKSTQMCC